MDLSHLGAPLGPMVRVHGGFANRMYRLDTDQGSFAVKELNLADRRRPYRAEDVFRFERAAFAAGIPMPEPISASHDTLVHRWVEGEKVPEAPVSAAYAFEIGEILARLHALDVAWTGAPVEEPETPRDWPELAARAVATGQPWADELASHVETFLAIARLVDTCERPGPVVLTHRDVQPWNLLAREGRPVVLDWELSGMLDLSGELGSTALSLAKGPGFDDIRPAVFRSVLDGYVAGGGALPPSGPSWFVYMVGGWLGHTRWNILRCLAGVEASTGPDLALSHESARNGVRGLPDLYGRLPELEALLL
ncbi:aminoglycoside phosphotransferase (APT) family kinase protein [Streptomyces sp. 1114.5]|uniref:phosphotransferase family protein n=1 Tax=unclassified Streptomyces TaxID=2593676 RepID=UPI000BD3BF0F|nr:MULTISPECIES: phosphotransferase [unclassified Streptomyces]RKT09413.1 aminoglycoside phosphotransferase (APT) family kinase protein [Streptomyces sp. 1114.5]SOB88582.1 Predicted kinase, aminoglycoside phosphotransferase (APT) family [Streptomyces sp. 1331.2]